MRTGMSGELQRKQNPAIIGKTKNFRQEKPADRKGWIDI